MNPIQLLSAAVIGLMQFAPQNLGPDQPVARIGERTITHREVNCNLALKDLSTTGKSVSRRSDEACLESEQQRLDYLIAEELFDAAVRRLGIYVSSDDLAHDALTNHYSEAEFERLSLRYCRLAKAALLVYRGEAIADVYARDIRSASDAISETEFENFVRLMISADAAVRFIARHTPEHFRTSITENARRRLGRDKVMEFLSQEAVKNGETYPVFAAKFWRALADDLRMQILDTRYKALSLEGLSWRSKRSSASQ